MIHEKGRRSCSWHAARFKSRMLLEYWIFLCYILNNQNYQSDHPQPKVSLCSHSALLCLLVCRPVSWALCWRRRSVAARICRWSWAARCWRWSAPGPTWRSCCSTTPGCSRTRRNTRPWKEPTTPCSTGQRQNRLCVWRVLKTRNSLNNGWKNVFKYQGTLVRLIHSSIFWVQGSIMLID